MQFCFTGQDPNSALQNLALKVVYSIRMIEWGERKKRRAGQMKSKNWTAVTARFQDAAAD